jgi:hypothetical protein
MAAARDAHGGTFQRTIRYAYDRTGNRTDGGNTSDAANQGSGWTYDRRAT